MTTAASAGSASRGTLAITVSPDARNEDRISLRSNVFPVPTPPETSTFAGSVGVDAHDATAALVVTDPVLPGRSPEWSVYRAAGPRWSE
ncbi:hypothetical protein TUM20983_50100 [Mycobacterium antarcticum]|nr:hypothetical protein TUM20983_50100 [Mycolicibacterium sp. TUM20983]